MQVMYHESTDYSEDIMLFHKKIQNLAKYKYTGGQIQK